MGSLLFFAFERDFAFDDAASANFTARKTVLTFRSLLPNKANANSLEWPLAICDVLGLESRLGHRGGCATVKSLIEESAS